MIFHVELHSNRMYLQLDLSLWLMLAKAPPQMGCGYFPWSTFKSSCRYTLIWWILNLNFRIGWYEHPCWSVRVQQSNEELVDPVKHIRNGPRSVFVYWKSLDPSLRAAQLQTNKERRDRGTTTSSIIKLQKREQTMRIYRRNKSNSKIF